MDVNTRHSAGKGKNENQNWPNRTARQRLTPGAALPPGALGGDEAIVPACPSCVALVTGSPRR